MSNYVGVEKWRKATPRAITMPIRIFLLPPDFLCETSLFVLPALFHCSVEFPTAKMPQKVYVTYNQVRPSPADV